MSQAGHRARDRRATRWRIATTARVLCSSMTDGAELAPVAPGDVRYERPSRAHALPDDFIDDLARRGCSNPQSVIWSGPPQDIDNAIHGSFARLGQRDFAVVCSVDGVSHVDIHWGGPARCAETIAMGLDRDAVTDGQVRDVPARGYGQGIDRATQKTIACYRDALGGAASPDRTHDGIEVATDKASTIYYCAKGRWTQLQGMD